MMRHQAEGTGCRTMPRTLLVAVLALLLPVAVGMSWTPTRAPIVSAALGTVLVVLLARVVGWRRAQVGLVGVSRTWLLAAIPLGLALVGVNVAIGMVLRGTDVAGSGATATLTPLLGSGGLALLVLHVVVLAPLEEELLFRGVLQGGLVERLGPLPGCALAAVAFTVVHGADAGAFHLLAGLVYGVVAWRSGSILPAVILHGVNNAAGVLLVVAAG